MNPNSTHVRKPACPSRRWKRTRRTRAYYPDNVVRGDTVKLHRPECGTNIELLTEQSRKNGRKILKEAFLFTRELPIKGRSKYPKA
jgi:hypothetical protein